MRREYSTEYVARIVAAKPPIPVKYTTSKGIHRFLSNESNHLIKQIGFHSFISVRGFREGEGNIQAAYIVFIAAPFRFTM